MSRFNIQPLPLHGLKLVERIKMGDERGFLSRLFCSDELHEAGWNKPIAQINHTFTAQVGVVRGMHYQHPPNAEMKLVSCLAGEVWDVAIDLRPRSETFLCWYAEILSAENCNALLIPEGFAHGFQTRSDNAVMLYCHSSAYNAKTEAGLHPLDPVLNIKWPLNVQGLSPRDKNHPLITNQFLGVEL